MSEHTKEPWRFRETLVYLASEGGFDLRDAPKAEANARRIVACVNACAGMPTDVLEDKSILKASAEILQQRDDLLFFKQTVINSSPLLDRCLSAEKQRDELLAALEKARPFINAWPQCRDNSTPHIEGSGLLSIVDDAIASVKGGA